MGQAHRSDQGRAGKLLSIQPGAYPRFWHAEHYRQDTDQYGFSDCRGKVWDLLGRKIPAGYCHLIPNTEEEEERLARLSPREVQFKNGQPNIFYVANNTAATYPIPVHLQRYTLYDYTSKKNLSCHYELFDLEDMLHCLGIWFRIETRIS